MEDRFNKRFRYPYVFLNEEPFSDQFKECVALPRSHSFRYTYCPCHPTRPQEDVWADGCTRRIRTHPSRSLASARLD